MLYCTFMVSSIHRMVRFYPGFMRIERGSSIKLTALPSWCCYCSARLPLLKGARSLTVNNNCSELRQSIEVHRCSSQRQLWSAVVGDVSRTSPDGDGIAKNAAEKKRSELASERRPFRVVVTAGQPGVGSRVEGQQLGAWCNSAGGGMGEMGG